MMIRADHINRHYFYPESFRDKADKFLSLYQIEREITCPPVKIISHKPAKERVCRFCGKGYPFVAFHKDAHVFPELLGNKYLTSDFECDDCNAQFGKYENDLANFLGIVRTVQSVKGKKMPKFKSADKNFEAEHEDDDQVGPIVKLKRFDGLNHTFHFDKEKQATIITYEKPPYIPLHVYKSFLKMGISALPAAEVNNYRHACEYLRNKKHDQDFTGFSMLQWYLMPLNFQFINPTGILFRKKDPASGIFTHVFMLFALNSIYQIVLPFHIQDRPMYTQSGSINTYWCPPLFGSDREWSINEVTSIAQNLNSTEKLYHQKESMSIPSRPGEYDKIKLINNETGEITEEDFDPSKVMGIDLWKSLITEE